MPGAVEIKICGLTNLEDARAAQSAGADFLGFVLYRRSPRGITVGTLRRIIDRLSGSPKVVGVFVNAPRNKVMRVAEDCGLFAVQFHGDESVDAAPAMPAVVWRAVRFCHGAASPLPEEWPAERYVLDATTPGVYGGTGIPVDWTAASALARQYPVMLAGGLTPENVTDAMRRVHPLGVDVASGVEKTPGKKDHQKIEAFIRAVRNCRKTGTQVLFGAGRSNES